MSKIPQEVQDKIVAQALKEIIFARRYKQGKVRARWQKNEAMLYGHKIVTGEARANVDLGRMNEFVNTLLSKIRTPLVFKFTKRKEAQLKRVKRLNALASSDRDRDFWDIKDLVGKKQSIVYGRAIYSYFADSVDGYKSHLTNIDVYDFLIDPAAGGIDIEQGMYMGDYGLCFTKEELYDMKGDSDYNAEAIAQLIEGTGNNTELPQEETNKRIRMYGQDTIGQRENVTQSDNKYKFWRWNTTFYNEVDKTSKRYYLVLQERAGKAIRVCPLEELFPSTKDFLKGPWPYWTYAQFPDLTEFWTPSDCDFVREIFQAQGVNINQMLDNAEAINKPQKAVNVGAIENLAELKYRKDGIIRMRGDMDITKAIQYLRPPAIDTPIKVYEILEGIREKASGVNAGDSGAAESDGKVAIYEGNQRASANRHELLQDSITYGHKRFAKLWELGVREHLTKKTAVDIIGPDGIETEEVTRRDIFKKSDEYGVMVEASDAETSASLERQQTQVAFLQQQIIAQGGPGAEKIVNPRKVFEFQAKIVGIDQDQIKDIMDTSEFGDAELMSECARDIERILDGEDVKPNAAANSAYMRRMLEWLQDHKEDMEEKTFNAFTVYMDALLPVVQANEARAVNFHAITMANAIATPVPGAPVPAGKPASPTPAAPMAPPDLGQPDQPNLSAPQVPPIQQ